MSKRRLWARFCLAIFALACISALPGKAFAEPLNSLTVHFEHEKTNVPNVATRVYLVATGDSATGTYTYIDSFIGSNVDLSAAGSSGKASDWDKAAKELDTYVSDKGIGAVQQGSSNGDGDVVFSGLSDGLYLVVSDSAQIGTDTYDFSSYLVALPSVDASGSVTHAVTSLPKGSIHRPTKPPTPTPPAPKPPTPPTPGRLAQTGDTWMPVIPFVIGGLILVAIGWKLHNDAKREKAEG